MTISHLPAVGCQYFIARLAVTFQAAEHHRPLAGTKLYCLVTEAHRCEQLAQGCYAGKTLIVDLLIARPTLYPLRHRATYLYVGPMRISYYPHMPISKVWIYRLLFVFRLFVRLRISPAKIKITASNFARWIRGVRGRESPILVNFASPEAQNRTNRPPTRK